MDAFSISTQDRERQEGCMGHPPLRSFLQHTAHSMPFPSSERSSRKHISFILTVHRPPHAMDAAHTGKNCSTDKPLPRRRSPHSSAPSDPTAVVPCSRVGRKHILQGVRDNEGWSLPAYSPPQTPSTSLQLEANGMQECGVCHSTLCSLQQDSLCLESRR